ncbi:hypothetical protein J6590_013002 [Homalodisca vitripennis]|nr:hypothetical protein J6590_013002 [Homalodisca vitripennis]
MKSNRDSRHGATRPLNVEVTTDRHYHRVLLNKKMKLGPILEVMLIAKTTGPGVLATHTLKLKLKFTYIQNNRHMVERDTCGRYFHTGGGAADRAIIWHYTCPGPAHTCTDTDVTNYTALLVVWYSPTGTDVTRETCKILTAELQITYWSRCSQHKATQADAQCADGHVATVYEWSATRGPLLARVISVQMITTNTGRCAVFRNKDSSFLCFLGGFLTALTTSAARLVRLNTVTSVSIWADLWSTGHAH